MHGVASSSCELFFFPKEKIARLEESINENKILFKDTAKGWKSAA
jgi:hypothetical protein